MRNRFPRLNFHFDAIVKRLILNSCVVINLNAIGYIGANWEGDILGPKCQKTMRPETHSNM